MPRTEYAYKTLEAPEGFFCRRCKISPEFHSSRLLANHLVGDHLISSKLAWEESTEIYNAYLHRHSLRKKATEQARESVPFEALPGAYVVKNAEIPVQTETLKSDPALVILPSPEEVKKQVEEQNKKPIITPIKELRKISEETITVPLLRGVRTVVQPHEVQYKNYRPKKKKVKKLSIPSILIQLDKNIIRLQKDIEGQTLMRDILKELQGYIS